MSHLHWHRGFSLCWRSRCSARTCWRSTACSVSLCRGCAGPVVGLLARTAPRLKLLGEQTALAAVLAQLRFVQRCALKHGGELVGGAPARRATPAVGQQSSLCRRRLGASWTASLG
jgi:hypothetical protein